MKPGTRGDRTESGGSERGGSNGQPLFVNRNTPTCRADVAQLGLNGVMHGVGISGAKFVAGYAMTVGPGRTTALINVLPQGLASSLVNWASSGAHGALIGQAIFAPGLTGAKFGLNQSGGSPNPFADGSTSAALYKFGKMVPWLGLGADLGEAAASCTR